MTMNKKLLSSLMGIKDARSTQGIMSRGANVYDGGNSSAHGGMPQSKLRPVNRGHQLRTPEDPNRPQPISKDAIRRRLAAQKKK